MRIEDYKLLNKIAATLQRKKPQNRVSLTDVIHELITEYKKGVKK